MIVYTLLLSYGDKDIVSIMLTSLIIYVIGYKVLPIEYNYIISAIIIVVDIYMSKDLIKNRSVLPIVKQKQKQKKQQKKHVTFAEDPIYFAPPVAPPVAPMYDINTPEYRLWVVKQQQQAQIQQQQQQAQINVQHNQQMYNDTDSSTSTESSASTASSEITYSSEDLE